MTDTTGDREQITDLLHRYSQAIDTKNWRQLRDCFTPEAVGRYQGREYDGRERLVRRMRDVHNSLDSSLHRVSNILVDIQGDHATGTAYVDALLIQFDHPAGPLHQIVGRYTDRYVRLDGRWLIADRTFEAFWVVDRKHTSKPSPESLTKLVRVEPGAEDYSD